MWICGVTGCHPPTGRPFEVLLSAGRSASCLRCLTMHKLRMAAWGLYPQPLLHTCSFSQLHAHAFATTCAHACIKGLLPSPPNHPHTCCSCPSAASSGEKSESSSSASTTSDSDSESDSFSCDTHAHTLSHTGYEREGSNEVGWREGGGRVEAGLRAG